MDFASSRMRSPFLGAIHEGFVAAEIAKLQAGAGRRREIYFFRDEQGLEVDLVVPGPVLTLLDCKASATVRPAMADSLVRLRRAAGSREVRSLVVHVPGRTSPPTTALRPGVQAIGIEGLAAIFGSSRRAR